jgi:hypothetical protein
MAIGGPLYGGPDSVKINVGFWIRVPEYHLNDTIVDFNIVEVLPRKYVGISVLILEVWPEEEIVCFTKERAKDLNGVSSQ